MSYILQITATFKHQIEIKSERKQVDETPCRKRVEPVFDLNLSAAKGRNIEPMGCGDSPTADTSGLSWFKKCLSELVDIFLFFQRFAI